MTIRTKLIAAFGILIVMMIALVAVSVTRMSTLNNAITEVINGPAHRLNVAQQIAIEMNTVVQLEKSMALTTDDAQTMAFDSQIGQHRKAIESLISEGSGSANGRAKAMWPRVQQQWSDLKPINDRVRLLARLNKNDEAGQISITISRKVAAEMFEAINQIVALQQDIMQQADEQTNMVYANARTTIIIVAIVAILIAIAGALWVSHIVSVGLSRIRTALDAVAVGDLDQTVTVTSNDEIKDLVETVNTMTGNLRQSSALADRIAAGDLTVEHKPLSDKDRLGIALNTMVDRLRAVATDANQAAEQVAAGSQQLSSASEQVSQGATEQAAAAEEASAS